MSENCPTCPTCGTECKYVEDRIVALKDYYEQYFRLSDLAIKKAEETMNARLESMNEFRSQIKDERDSYASREAMDLLIGNLDTRLRATENQYNRLLGYMIGSGLLGGGIVAGILKGFGG